MLNAEDYRRMKAKIESNIDVAFTDYCRENDCAELFLKPEVAYFDAKCDIFDKLDERGVSESMKRIYRAGKTLIMFTVPFSDAVIESNREGDEPSELWIQAYRHSISLQMKLNSSIKATLKEWGRVTSSLNTPMDWSRKKPGEIWSHKVAGAVAGLGSMTAAGLFIDRSGRYARVSGVVTDCDIAGRYEGDTDVLLEKVLQVPVTEKETKTCPCGAITKEGVDRFRCQDYCMKFNDTVPSPEVCGKCIRIPKTKEQDKEERSGILWDIVDFIGSIWLFSDL